MGAFALVVANCDQKVERFQRARESLVVGFGRRKADHVERMKMSEYLVQGEVQVQPWDVAS
jgi:hypothetical protein